MGEEGKETEMAATAAVNTGPAVLERVFAAQHEHVFRAAYRITGNTSDAEDVLQTVFLRLLRQNWAPSSVGSVEMYLHRAAVNAALDVLRLRRDSRQQALEDVEAVLADHRSLRPDQRHSAAELRGALRSALARISSKAAEMFALRYFEGYDNPEIARMLGTSVGNVAVTLHRTREQLQQELEAHVGRHGA